MLVAIEGVDRTGKSTLAAELCDGLGGAVVHAGPPGGGSLAAYEDAIRWYDPLGGEPLFLDRWHVGEYVWPEIFRRPTDMVDPAVRRHVEMFMCSRGCVVVYAIRDYDELRVDLVENDEPLRPASLPLALQRFDEALNHGHNRGFVFEHEHLLHHLNAQDVEFVASQADGDVWPLHGVTGRWIGHPNPIWAIAVSGYSDGDVPGRRGAGLDPTVAHILRDLPEQAWRGFAIVEVGGMSPDAFAEFARLADPLNWIGLGDEADELLDGIDVRSRRYSPGFSVLKQTPVSSVMDAWAEDWEDSWERG